MFFPGQTSASPCSPIDAGWRTWGPHSRRGNGSCLPLWLQRAAAGRLACWQPAPGVPPCPGVALLQDKAPRSTIPHCWPRHLFGHALLAAQGCSKGQSCLPLPACLGACAARRPQCSSRQSGVQCDMHCAGEMTMVRCTITWSSRCGVRRCSGTTCPSTQRGKLLANAPRAMQLGYRRHVSIFVHLPALCGCVCCRGGLLYTLNVQCPEDKWGQEQAMLRPIAESFSVL